MKRSSVRLALLLAILFALSSVANYRVAFATPEVGISQAPTTAPAVGINTYYQKVYDVRGLIVPIPDFDNAPLLGVQADLSASPPPSTQPVISREAMLERVVNSVRARLGGDPQATVMSVNGQLLVHASADGHRRVESFIERARRQRNAQINVESHFVTIDAKALAGIDPDLQELCDSANISGGSTPITDAQEVALLKAAQDLGKSAVVTAPRVTLFQNQRAYVLVSTQTAYVRDFAAKTGANAKPFFEPVIGTVGDGTLLDMRASCDAAASTVSLDYHPQTAEFLGFTVQPWAKSPQGRDLKVQVPHVRTQSAHQLMTIASGHSSLVWLGDTGKVWEKSGNEWIVIVTPTIISPRD